MGYAGDILGRNTAMALTLSLVSVGALMSAVAPWGSASSVYAIIIVARFILGVGAGGVYPLSATKAAEDSGSDGGVSMHGAAWAFFWQQPGAMVHPIATHQALFLLLTVLYVYFNRLHGY
jgi:PHS family inorganic phosphate transporter-like MFS transporter